ncbi:MAG: phosphotransferase family protein [Actinomycetota bacterium]
MGEHEIITEGAEDWVRAFVPSAGRLELFQSEPWGSVFRVRVDADPVWFKACAPRQAFEVPMTAALSARWKSVTDVIAHDAGRRWLLMADAGETFRTLGNPPERWIEILPAYAELQVEETGHADEHLARGVPDLRLERLPGLYEEVLGAELPVDAAEKRALESLAPLLPDWCDELAAAGIGPTVQHDDLHMNNVYVKGDSLRVLDWGDSSIAHPFFSLFETFRFLVALNGLPDDDPWFARLRDAYLEPWGSGHRRAFHLALRLAGPAHAIAWLHQRKALPVADRAEFDVGYAEILRLTLRRAAESTG